MKNKTRILAASLALILLLSGCAYKNVPDNGLLSQAELEKITSWSKTGDGIAASSIFSLMDSEQLRALVKEALNANPSLQQTSLALQIVQTQLRQSKGQRFIQADAELSFSREEDDAESYGGGISVSWTADLWGKLTDEVNSARMDVAQQEALLQSAQDSLVAEIMKTWLELITSSNGVKIQQRRLDTLEKNEKYILERYRSGLGSLEDLDSARSSSSSARATLVEYQEGIERLRGTLRVLLGRSNAESLEIPAQYPLVPTPLADLPEQTLARRPDLQAAYFAIKSADLQTSIAYKELLPEINISAALQDIGDSPSSLLLAAPLWSLLGQLTAPLFRGGTLKAAAEAAELNAALTYQAYRETLLTAVQEVEDSLSYERELSQRIHHIESALAAAGNSLESFKKSYRSGLVDILDLLTVQTKTYDLELELDNLIYSQLANRIDLGLALGLGVQEK